MDSTLEQHQNFDPKMDAMVAAWVLASRRQDWASMTDEERGRAYIDYFVDMSDEDIEEFFPDGHFKGA